MSSDFNIVYTLNSSTLNMIKLLSDIHHIESLVTLEQYIKLHEEIFMIYRIGSLVDKYTMYGKCVGSTRDGKVKDKLNRLIDGINQVISESYSKFKGTYYLDDDLRSSTTESNLNSSSILQDRMVVDSLQYFFIIHHSEVLTQFKNLCDKVNLLSTFLNKSSDVICIGKVRTEEIEYLYNHVNTISFIDKFKQDTKHIEYDEIAKYTERLSSEVSNSKTQILQMAESLIVTTVPAMISEKAIKKDELVSVIESIFMKEDIGYRERIITYMESNFIDLGMQLYDDVSINNSLQRSGILSMSDTLRKENQITE